MMCCTPGMPSFVPAAAWPGAERPLGAAAAAAAEVVKLRAKLEAFTEVSAPQRDDALVAVRARACSSPGKNSPAGRRSAEVMGNDSVLIGRAVIQPMFIRHAAREEPYAAPAVAAAAAADRGSAVLSHRAVHNLLPCQRQMWVK